MSPVACPFCPDQTMRIPPGDKPSLDPPTARGAGSVDGPTRGLDLHLTAQLPSSGFPILTSHDSLDSEIRCCGKAMSQPRDDRQDDLFQPSLETMSLETIMNLRHPLVRL